MRILSETAVGGRATHFELVFMVLYVPNTVFIVCRLTTTYRFAFACRLNRSLLAGLGWGALPFLQPLPLCVHKILRLPTFDCWGGEGERQPIFQQAC